MASTFQLKPGSTKYYDSPCDKFTKNEMVTLRVKEESSFTTFKWHLDFVPR